ncbi:SDR family oxidoreductase [Egicoccus sp. AB-alg6-2]|uniref:SDR family oxidoreductase n=1 Tax=Egicoccus sp. AB-alg6-2 TaxID=3242692 RepID=UPI00359D9D92
MPVLVTGAHRPLARRIALRLLEEGGEVRAYGDGDTAVLRSAGAFVATGTTDDEGRLESALADVHTVVHVGGGLLGRDAEADVAAAEVLVTAATNAGVARLVVLSLPGASADAEDPYRRARGRIEELVAAAAPPSVVIRTSLVDTPAMRDALATAGFGPTVLDTEVAPVDPGDLVELVVAFDRARSRSERGHLLVAADGPVRLSIGDWLGRLGVARPGRGSLLGRRLTDPEQSPLLADALATGPWYSDGPGVLDGWEFAGFHPSPPGVGG